MKVKVCGIYDSVNLEALLKLQPDFIGLNFYPESKRFCRWGKLPELDYGKSSLVGVFVNAALEQIVEKTKKFKLSFLQLHGTENRNEILEIRKELPETKIIKVFGIEQAEDLDDLESWEAVADYFLFDKKSISFGGTGQKFSWDLLNRVSVEKEFFLAGGIGKEDARAIKVLKNELPNFFAVDINSRFENQSGIKDIASIQKFIEELRK